MADKKEGAGDLWKAALAAAGLATAGVGAGKAEAYQVTREAPRAAEAIRLTTLSDDDVLSRLGTGRFAQNREQAYSDAYIAEAADGLVRALPQELLSRQQNENQIRDAIAALLRAHKDNPGEATFLSPVQRFEGMLGRDRNGLVVLGEGESDAQLNTDRVPGTRSGYVAYAAEQMTSAPLTLSDGRQIRLVIHDPADCDNFTIDIIEVPMEHPAPPQAPEGEPCSVVSIPGFPPGTKVAVPVVWAESAEDADRPSECWAVTRSDEEDFTMPVCEGNTCLYLETAIDLINRTRPSNRREQLTGLVYEAEVGEDGVARVRIPRSTTRRNGTTVATEGGGYWVGACPKDLREGGRRTQTNMRVAEPMDLSDGEHTFTAGGWRRFN